jgi:hypothetical protein
MFLSLRKCFCLSANGFVSSTIVFASSPMSGRLRPLSLLLRQRQDVPDHCLHFIDHVSDASDQVLRVCYRSRLRYFPAVCGSPIASRKPAKARCQGNMDTHALSQIFFNGCPDVSIQRRVLGQKMRMDEDCMRVLPYRHGIK